MAGLSIIHTNDLHGQLKVPAAERLRRLALESPGALLLDSGDAISAGNLGVRVGGEPILTLMSELGYSAMTLGNRESHPRREIFPHKIDTARFPILCANMQAKRGAPAPVVPSVVLQASGVRVGVFGVTVPMFTRKQWSQPFCDYLFTSPFEAAASEFEKLAPQSDLVIALTHVGYQQDLQLARKLPGLALLIGGHSHTDLEKPTWVGAVPVVQARAFGFYAGVAELDRSEGAWSLTAWRKTPLRDDAPVLRAQGG